MLNLLVVTVVSVCNICNCTICKVISYNLSWVTDTSLTFVISRIALLSDRICNLVSFLIISWKTCNLIIPSLCSCCRGRVLGNSKCCILTIDRDCWTLTILSKSEINCGCSSCCWFCLESHRKSTVVWSFSKLISIVSPCNGSRQCHRNLFRKFR